MATETQMYYLRTIYDMYREKGYVPTVSEIASKVKRQKSTVFFAIDTLCKKGFMMKTGKGIFRNIRFTPDGYAKLGVDPHGK